MRSLLVCVVGLLALLPQPQSSIAQQVPLPQLDPVAVKLRLEIELRGVLSVTEKTATLTNKETIWEWVEVPEFRDPTGYHAPSPGGMTLQSRQVDKVWVLDLDANLRKVAKALHGKEAVVIGKCLVLGVESRAETSKAPTVSELKPARGNERVPTTEVLATSVTSRLRLDTTVTVLSLQAAK
jgi:hypothetical protein